MPLPAETWIHKGVIAGVGIDVPDCVGPTASSGRSHAAKCHGAHECIHPILQFPFCLAFISRAASVGVNKLLELQQPQSPP